MAWTSPNGDGTHSSVKVAYRSGGTWRAPHDLGPGEVGGVVIDGDGDLTVAWGGRPPSEAAVGEEMTVSRLVSGLWQAPQVLDHQGWTPELAVNRRGELAMVWATTNGVGVSVRRRGTPTWEAPTHVKGIPLPDDPHIAIDDRGRALALWARSTESESFARRHLAWTATRENHTWTSARFLDERAHRTVIGDDATSAMNARGQALAAWSPDSTGQGGFRVAQFTFAKGWSTPQRLANLASQPAALVTRTGSSLVVLNFDPRPGWVYRPSGSDWSVGGTAVGRDPLDTFGDGRRMVALYSAGRNLMARFLRIPAHR